MNETYSVQIQNMDCADCALKLSKGVAALDGVLSCQVDFVSARMELHLDPAQASLAQVEQRVHTLGYRMTANSAAAANTAPSGWRTSQALTTLLAALLLLIALLTRAAALPQVWSLICYSAAVAVGGWPIVRKAWGSMRINHEMDINVLMTLAVAGALVIGEWSEAAVVVVLFSLGETLESVTISRARRSIRSLMQLSPAEATVLQPCLDCATHSGHPLPDGKIYRDGPCPWCGTHEQIRPVAEMAIGDRVLVRAGERIPIDGVVLTGSSAVNQAPITGESLPADKTTGDEVFAGTINGTGVLEIATTRLAADNTLSRLIELVEQAQAQKAPAQRWIDRFARVYTPAVALLALLVAVLPSLLWQQPLLPQGGDAGWLYRALTLLVIACPCALVISTPVSVASAISTAARHGVLIKGGATLEALGSLRVVAFDKTGTLTEGRPVLAAARCTQPAPHTTDCDQCRDLLALAAALERRSEHPLAAAVVQAAAAQQLDSRYPAADAVEALAGRGLRGAVNGRLVHISSHRAAHQQAIAHSAELCRQITSAETAGQTTMLLHEAQTLRGFLAVTDQLRPGSATAIAALRATGIEHVVLLTGDNQATAEAIAAQAGVDAVYANLLPADKVQQVETLLQEHGAVAMVGDGINDAPALARATTGISLGGAGSDQALETADVVLMGDDLAALPPAVQLSRRARRIIRQNVVFSLALKAVFLLLAFTGTATLWMAVFADVGASLLVILNGMRLLHHPAASPAVATVS
ncbi:MAG: heavy metal translocating P-type ATPase [Caldilineales bacterium]